MTKVQGQDRANPRKVLRAHDGDLRRPERTTRWACFARGARHYHHTVRDARASRNPPRIDRAGPSHSTDHCRKHACERGRESAAQECAVQRANCQRRHLHPVQGRLHFTLSHVKRSTSRALLLRRQRTCGSWYSSFQQRQYRRASRRGHR